jgi:4'-phosphopantetheinyl transferase
MSTTAALLRSVRRLRITAFGRRIDVWVAAIRPNTYLDPDTPVLRAFLPEGELRRLSAIDHAEARAEYAAGRLLVRSVLAERLGTAPTRIRIGEEPGGRPRLERGLGGRPTDDFNLSHSGGRLALCVSRNLRVGVDIERVDSTRPLQALACRYYTADEQTLLNAHTGTDAYADCWYRIWTTKEAHAKARGIGVRALAEPLDGHGTRWRRHPIPVAPGFAGSVVALHPSCPPYPSHPFVPHRKLGSDDE